jgi:hypothetical protein
VPFRTPPDPTWGRAFLGGEAWGCAAHGGLGAIRHKVVLAIAAEAQLVLHGEGLDGIGPRHGLVELGVDGLGGLGGLVSRHAALLGVGLVDAALGLQVGGGLAVGGLLR